MKKLVGQSWIPADEYGHSLPPFTVNLLSSDLARAARFYSEVLGATIVYSDPDRKCRSEQLTATEAPDRKADEIADEEPAEAQSAAKAARGEATR